MKVHVLFDGPPGPEAGRFVEVETLDGKSVNVGRWIDRGDGYWALELELNDQQPYPESLREAKRYADLAYTGNPDRPLAAALAQACATIALAEMQEQSR